MRLKPFYRYSKLIGRQWSALTLADNRKKKKALNQAQGLPLAEEVSKYQNFLKFKIEELLQLHILSATDQKLLKIFLLSSILTFNRRRTSEVHFLTFSQYLSAKKVNRDPFQWRVGILPSTSFRLSCLPQGSVQRYLRILHIKCLCVYFILQRWFYSNGMADSIALFWTDVSSCPLPFRQTTFKSEAIILHDICQFCELKSPTIQLQLKLYIKV